MVEILVRGLTRQSTGRPTATLLGTLRAARSGTGYFRR